MKGLADTFAFAHLCILLNLFYPAQLILYSRFTFFFSVLAFSENHEYASAKHYPNNNNNKYYPLLLLLSFNNNNNIILIIFINVDNCENAVK